MESQINIVKKTKNIACITFNGRLDAICRDQVKDTLHSALDTPCSIVVVDLKNVPFIDSSGLSALVSGLRFARENNKDIILTEPNKQARMVFELTMMDKIFAIYPSMQSAVDMLLT